MNTDISLLVALAETLAGSAQAQIIKRGPDNVPPLFSSGGWAQQNSSSFDVPEPASLLVLGLAAAVIIPQSMRAA